MRHWSGWEEAFFAAFLFWAACGLLFTLAHVSPGSVAAWPLPGLLRSFAGGCVAIGDPVLILVAFANTHLLASRQWSARAARRWALMVLAVSFAVETVGVETGLPFGAYRYTERFGPMLGVVPLAIPLAWYVVVTNALFVARAVTRGRSAALTALLAGLLCTAYDAVLEPFATVVRHYWDWTGGTVPPQNYAAWLILSTLLAALCAPRARGGNPSRDPRPVVLLGVTLLIFLAGSW